MEIADAFPSSSPTRLSSECPLAPAHPCRELGEALEQQRAMRVIFWSSEPARARIEVTGSQFLPNFGRT